jgi:FlaA1/EpsC-like NDP-sugar epimerase
MQSILQTWRPHTIYHAAAYKHVPMVEHNLIEGVRNNVFGTLVTARLADDFGCEDFVLISTDKAVRPTNVMGASKRLAEMVLQALADAPRSDGAAREVSTSQTTQQQRKRDAGRTRYSMVRFGNVLGSSGSVVPKFRQQIRDGGPITLTHAEMTRYFMTIPEAAQLVIQAGAMATGGDVFVLDMGEPVRIRDLALRMIELSGLSLKKSPESDGDIEIVVTGLRPGEKLYEELLIGDNPQPTMHPRIMKAHEEYLAWPVLQPALDALDQAMQDADPSGVRRQLQQLVNGFAPVSDLVDWVHLAQQPVRQ